MALERLGNWTLVTKYTPLSIEENPVMLKKKKKIPIDMNTSFTQTHNLAQPISSLSEGN